MTTDWNADLHTLVHEMIALENNNIDASIPPTIVARSEIGKRLAEEHDAAPERGEVAIKGQPSNVTGPNNKATVEGLGLPRKGIHEAQTLRDARLPAVNSIDSERHEIRQRVSNFRAHQERFAREREDFARSVMKRMLARTPPADRNG
jgi:hypothetical protein